MKRINDIDLENKKVVIRVDYNVPLDSNLNIVDDNRIKESLETINYCLENILMKVGIFIKINKIEIKLKFSGVSNIG